MAAELSSRIGKRVEQFYPNRTWVKPGLESKEGVTKSPSKAYKAGRGQESTSRWSTSGYESEKWSSSRTDINEEQPSLLNRLKSPSEHVASNSVTTSPRSLLERVHSTSHGNRTTSASFSSTLPIATKSNPAPQSHLDDRTRAVAESNGDRVAAKHAGSFISNGSETRKPSQPATQSGSPDVFGPLLVNESVEASGGNPEEQCFEVPGLCASSSTATTSGAPRCGDAWEVSAAAGPSILKPKLKPTISTDTSRNGKVLEEAFDVPGLSASKNRFPSHVHTNPNPKLAGEFEIPGLTTTQTSPAAVPVMPIPPITPTSVTFSVNNSASTLTHSQLLKHVRDVLTPLIIQNTECRMGSQPEAGLNRKDVTQKARAMLTDEVCQSFIQKSIQARGALDEIERVAQPRAEEHSTHAHNSALSVPNGQQSVATGNITAAPRTSTIPSAGHSSFPSDYHSHRYPPDNSAEMTPKAPKAMLQHLRSRSRSHSPMQLDRNVAPLASFNGPRKRSTSPPLNQNERGIRAFGFTRRSRSPQQRSQSPKSQQHYSYRADAVGDRAAMPYARRRSPSPAPRSGRISPSVQRRYTGRFSPPPQSATSSRFSTSSRPWNVPPSRSSRSRSTERNRERRISPGPCNPKKPYSPVRRAGPPRGWSRPPPPRQEPPYSNPKAKGYQKPQWNRRSRSPIELKPDIAMLDRKMHRYNDRHGGYSHPNDRSPRQRRYSGATSSQSGSFHRSDNRGQRHTGGGHGDSGWARVKQEPVEIISLLDDQDYYAPPVNRSFQQPIPIPIPLSPSPPRDMSAMDTFRDTRASRMYAAGGSGDLSAPPQSNMSWQNQAQNQQGQQQPTRSVFDMLDDEDVKPDIRALELLLEEMKRNGAANSLGIGGGPVVVQTPAAVPMSLDPPAVVRHPDDQRSSEDVRIPEDWYNESVPSRVTQEQHERQRQGPQDYQLRQEQSMQDVVEREGDVRERYGSGERMSVSIPEQPKYSQTQVQQDFGLGAQEDTALLEPGRRESELDGPAAVVEASNSKGVQGPEKQDNNEDEDMKFQERSQEQKREEQKCVQEQEREPKVTQAKGKGTVVQKQDSEQEHETETMQEKGQERSVSLPSEPEESGNTEASDEQESDSEQQQQPVAPVVVVPCHFVPGVWIIQAGSTGIASMDCRFVIDEETYIKWDLDKFDHSATRAGDFVSTDVKQRQSNLDLRLLCFHTDRVQEILSSLKQDATLTDIAAVLSDLQQTWPPPQDYIVILNPDHASKQRIWISYKLPSDDIPEGERPTVQLENHLTIGENVLRIIQLTDLAQFTFVLYACERQTTELDEFLVRARRALRNEELPEDDRMDTVGDDDESHRKRPPIPSVAVTVRLDGY